MRLAVLVWTAALAGCSIEVPSTLEVDPDEVDDADDTGDLDDPAPQRGPVARGEGKLSSNGLHLVPELLPGLEAVSLSAAASELAASEEGTQHLEYLALCALDEGDALEVDGASYSGLYGLAPRWASGACDDSCQRWVTACVLAHANAFGVEVTISLRGEHPGLAWDDDIVAEFPLQEAAFYGNLFTDTESWRAPIYACAGTALIEFEHGFPRLADDPWSYLDTRICSLDLPCGLDQTGACHAPLELPPPCDAGATDSGYYGDCRGPRVPLAPLRSPKHPEIITAYLAPD
ncbi:MAG TPA: hypothetical protein VMZ28_17160 [Kofleriaceae bacterium]|nr:hypothetical protein [Kofleriaceae bacterium]